MISRPFFEKLFLIGYHFLLSPIKGLFYFIATYTFLEFAEKILRYPYHQVTMFSYTYEVIHLRSGTLLVSFKLETFNLKPALLKDFSSLRSSK